jgi:hypothetical protein
MTSCYASGPRRRYNGGLYQSKDNLKIRRKPIEAQDQASLEDNIGKDEMYANCFVLEKDTKGKKLVFCSLCRLATYCSPGYQRVHWKQRHKQQCVGKKKKKKKS